MEHEGGDQVRRRDFIAAVSGAAIAWPLTGLIGAGFVEGHYIIDRISLAEGQYARLSALTAALVSLQ